MRECAHGAWLHNLNDGSMTCYWCGAEGSMTFTPEDVQRLTRTPTPRDEVDEFILTLKGVAR